MSQLQVPDKRNIPFFNTEGIWKKDKDSIWFGSSLTLVRNLEKYHFPEKLPIESGRQLTSFLSKGLMESPLMKGPKTIRLNEIQSIDSEFFNEHFLLGDSSTAPKEYPAYVVDEGGEFIASINCQDHLRLQYTTSEENLDKTWEKLLSLETFLSGLMTFSFSERFGFLTSDSSECGTGLVIKIYLHLPALIHAQKLEETLERLSFEGIETSGLLGDHQLIGDIAVFENLYKIGVTEELLISSMRSLATKLSFEEKALRKSIKAQSESETTEIRDKISRAFAILLHSYQIEAIEAFNSLSLLKLGVDLGFVEGVSQSTLAFLLLSSRRAHLLSQYDKPLSSEELPHKRAEFIHKTLGNQIKLVI